MTGTKKKVETKKVAEQKTKKGAQTNEKPKSNSPSADTSKDSAAGDNAGNGSGSEGEKTGRVADVFKKVIEMVEVPGAGPIPVKLIEVEFNGQKHRERTRREATFWLRARRKEAAQRERQTKEIERMEKEIERAEKVSGFLVGRLENMSGKISTLCGSKVLTDEQREKISAAAKILSEVASERKEQEAEAKK